MDSAKLVKGIAYWIAENKMFLLENYLDHSCCSTIGISGSKRPGITMVT
jgi:hypothetical protein